jgi:excisionase family DNA binding protein
MALDPAAAVEPAPPVTVAEFRRATGLSKSEAYALLTERRIAHHRHGRRIMIPAAELARYLAETFVPAIADSPGGTAA